LPSPILFLSSSSSSSSSSSYIIRGLIKLGESGGLKRKKIKKKKNYSFYEHGTLWGSAPLMIYEEDDDDNDDSDMDDDMMISPHLSSKESAPSRRVGFVEGSLRGPGPGFMSV